MIETAYQYTRPQRLQRVGDPSQGYPTTREELFSYDVILCSDIDRSAFTPEQLNWTVELVAERGGGFAMIGGVTSFGAGLWDQTVWDQIIPVDMSGKAPGSRGAGWAYTPFLVRVPAEAEQHPIWRIVDDPLRNREILARLPQFYGTNLIDRVKPGGTVLGVTDRQLPGAGGIMPVFACQAYGRGRTFAMTTGHDVRLGQGFRAVLGRERQPLLPQVLAKRRQLAGRKLGPRLPPVANRNGQADLSSGPADSRHRAGLRRETGGNHQVSPGRPVALGHTPNGRHRGPA